MDPERVNPNSSAKTRFFSFENSTQLDRPGGPGKPPNGLILVDKSIHYLKVTLNKHVFQWLARNTAVNATDETGYVDFGTPAGGQSAGSQSAPHVAEPSPALADVRPWQKVCRKLPWRMDLLGASQEEYGGEPLTI